MIDSVGNVLKVIHASDEQRYDPDGAALLVRLSVHANLMKKDTYLF